jgi:hypothetical protein
MHAIADAIAERALTKIPDRKSNRFGSFNEVAGDEALQDLQHTRAIETTKILLIAKIPAKRLDQAKLGRGR